MRKTRRNYFIPAYNSVTTQRNVFREFAFQWSYQPNVLLWPSDIFGKFSQLLSCDVSMNDNYKKVMVHQISLHQENSLSEHSISWKLFQELSVRVQQIVSEYQALTIIYCFHRGSFVFRGKDSFEGSEKTKCDRGEDKLLIKIKKNIIFISCNLVESIIV